MASSSSSSVVDNSRIRNERLRDERRRAIPRTRVVDLLDASRRWHKIRVTEIPPPRASSSRARRAARRSRVKCPRPLSGGVSKIAFAFARRAPFDRIAGTISRRPRRSTGARRRARRRRTERARASLCGPRRVVRSFFRFFVFSFVRSFVHTALSRVARVARRIARIARVARGVRGVERGGARERRGDLGVVAVRLRVRERVDGGVRGAMRGVEGVALARGGVARCHLRRDALAASVARAKRAKRARETRRTRTNANAKSRASRRVASRAP